MSDSPWAVEPQPGWKLLRLKHVCRFVGGGTPDTGTAEYWQGDIPWVSPKDMKTSRIRDAEDHISDEGLKASATRLVGIGAVLIVMRSGILRHSIPVAVNEVPVALNQDMKALLTDSRLLPEYLARLVEGHQKELLKAWRKEGATVESLEFDLLGNTLVPIPPAEVQQAIADYLDQETARLDALIAAKERLLVLLTEKRQALITRAVTRGLDPNAPLRDSGIPWLGPIPAHWETKRGKWVFHQSALPVRDMDEIVTCFRDGQVTLRRNRREDGFMVAEKEIGYQGIRTGQLVLHSMDAFAGAIGVSDSDGKCSPEYIICEPGRSEVSPLYYGFLLRWMALAGFIQASCPAVRERAPRIRFNDLAEMLLPIPPVDEQTAIVRIICKETEKLHRFFEATERTIAFLKERRSALIAAAVTGRIAIPSESIP